MAYVSAAYLLAALLFLAYVLSLRSRQRMISDMIEALRQREGRA